MSKEHRTRCSCSAYTAAKDTSEARPERYKEDVTYVVQQALHRDLRILPHLPDSEIITRGCQQIFSTQRSLGIPHHFGRGIRVIKRSFRYEATRCFV